MRAFRQFPRSSAVNTKRGRWYDEVRQPPVYIPAISSFHPSSPLLRALPHSLLRCPEGPISSSFSPSGPSRSVCSLCTASRLLLLLLALLFLFLLLRPPPPSSFAPSIASLFVPPPTLGSSLPRDSFLLFLSPPSCLPFGSRSELVQLLLLFWPSERERR